MAFQIKGKLEFVGETNARNSKNGGQPFYRREFVLDCTRYNPDTGEPWENHPKFELNGDKCQLIDKFRIGQKVVVDFSLRGAKYADQQTGEMKYFTSINAFKIELAEESGQSQFQPQTAPTGQQPVAVQPQQTFPPKVDENGEVVNTDDLPF